MYRCSGKGENRKYDAKMHISLSRVSERKVREKTENNVQEREENKKMTMRMQSESKRKQEEREVEKTEML